MLSILNRVSLIQNAQRTPTRVQFSGNNKATLNADAFRLTSHSCRYPAQNRLRERALRDSGCSLIAAWAVLQALGIPRDLSEIQGTALQKNVWHPELGMVAYAPVKNGEAFVQLMKFYDVAMTAYKGVPWNLIKKELQQYPELPIVVRLGGHYWIVEKYDAEKDLYFIGASAQARRNPLSAWVSEEQLMAEVRDSTKVHTYAVDHAAH